MTDLTSIRKVYDEVFDDGKKYSDYIFKHKYGIENALWHSEDGKVVSVLFISDRKLSIRGIEIACPYICGVATLPSYRNRGIAENLINKAFGILQKNGLSICALHPFRHSFYEKFGFVTYTKVKRYKISCKLPDNNIKLKVVKDADVPFIKQCYEKYMAPYFGYSLRDDAETLRRIGEMRAAGKCFIIERGGERKGYIYLEEGFVNEYCAPWEYIDSIPKISGMEVNLPPDFKEGELSDFTMIKLLDRNLFLLQLGIKDLELFSSLSDKELILTLTGSYGQFGFEPPPQIADKFCEITNYVFDKY